MCVSVSVRVFVCVCPTFTMQFNTKHVFGYMKYKVQKQCLQVAKKKGNTW